MALQHWEIDPSHAPYPGTADGDRARETFIAQMLAMGKCELFWLPKAGNTTTNTDESLDARVITYSKDVTTFDTPPATLGSGLYVDFDGVDEEADTPDVADLSFVSGGADQAFSIMALIKPDDVTPTLQNSIFSKLDKDTDAEIREYTSRLSSTNGYPGLVLYDESVPAWIGGEDQTALVQDAWTLVTFTYDGSGVNAGIKIFINDAAATVTAISSATYIAMEDLDTLPQIGFVLSAAATSLPEEFFAGGMAFIYVVRKELVAIEIEAMKGYVNAFYALSL